MKTIQKHNVLKAEPYKGNNLGSFGNASNMLLSQHNFPNRYTDDDIMISAYHDRCREWDYKHTMEACKKAFNSGDMDIGGWVRSARHDKVMDFLIDILKAKRSVKWTGWRVLGTVHRSNGYPIFTLELFCNKSNAETSSDTPCECWGTIGDYE